MFDRFTDRARKVMGLARQAAQRHDHDYIDPEHILLGLVQEGSGVAASALRSLAVDLHRIFRDVRDLIRGGTTMVTMGRIPFTSRAKKMLELTLEEATELGHDYIGTEHLLLGLIREDEGIAARVLRDHGVTLEAARRQVLELIAAEPADLDAGLRAGDRIREAESAAAWRHRLGTLLGLLTPSEGEVADLLRENGADRAALIDAIRRRLNEA